MTSEIQIHNLRLSFIWVETVLNRLERRSSYKERFDQVLRSGMGLKGLHLPWSELGRHFFWSYYLEHGAPGNISGNRAWKELVPFREKVPAAVEVCWLQGRLVLEAFYYPHGFALVVTAVCCTDLTLEEAVEKAFEVRRTGRFQVKWVRPTGRFQVEWDEGEAPEFLSLDAFADKGLTALRKVALGPGAAPGARRFTPFTVVTVVRGTGVNPVAPTPNGGEVHRALEAMTTWRPTWRYDVLPNLAEVSLKIRPAPPSHVLYGHTRGRAVWFPGLFIQKDRRLHSLACYHRNLVFTSLQVESLSGLISETAKQIRDGTPLSAAHRECARRAVGILGRLYGGAPSTYRTWSPRAHIEQNDLVMAVNEVRDLFNMDKLS